MIVIIKTLTDTSFKRFKHKTIRYWLYILINKIKGKEVFVINEKDI
jgi:hypothetical protein